MGSAEVFGGCFLKYLPLFWYFLLIIDFLLFTKNNRWNEKITILEGRRRLVTHGGLFYTEKYVLQEGLVRRSGNGQLTNVWHDRWISNHLLGWPFTLAGDQQIQLVSELLTPSGQWNKDLIREVFGKFDAEADPFYND